NPQKARIRIGPKGVGMPTDEGPSPAEPITDDPAVDPALPAHIQSSLLDSSRPTWQRVLVLAGPVLLQQLLLMAVGLYDQYLAGVNTPADESLHVSYQAAQT